MAHECPECGDPCRCLPGDVIETNCVHCDDIDYDEDDDVDTDEDED